jgi:hypothetical protein
LRGASLRGANLTSANLTRAQLQGTDLTDANVDLGEDIVAITPVSDDQFLALTSASTVLDLRVADGALVTTEIKTDTVVQHPRDIGYLAEDLVMIAGRGEVATFEQRGTTGELAAHFLIDNDIIQLRTAPPSRIRLVREGHARMDAAVVNLDTGIPDWNPLLMPPISAVAVVMHAVVWSADERRLYLRRRDGEEAVYEDTPPASALAAIDDAANSIVIGTADGRLIISRKEGLAEATAHVGRVTAIGATSRYIVSASADGSLALSEAVTTSGPVVIARQPRRLQCVGAVVDSSTSLTEREQLLANGAIDADA